jgi:outer membrane immunogenic protein
MRKFLFVLAGCTAFSGAALAADLPIIEQPVFVEPPVIYNWTGVYIGLQGGYAWGDSSFDVRDTDTPPDFQPFTVNTDPSGFIGGGHAGALYQFNNIVVGIEGDVEYNGMEDSGRANVFDFAGNRLGRLDVDVDYNMSASVRGRVGLAFDRYLLYATGGYAYASIDHIFTARGGGDVEVLTFDEGFNGWTAGGGLDAFVTQNLSAGLEYRYTSLEDKTFRFGDAAIETDHDFHAIRARASFHF